MNSKAIIKIVSITVVVLIITATVIWYNGGFSGENSTLREDNNEENSLSGQETLFMGEVKEVDTSNKRLIISLEEDDETTITYSDETIFESFEGTIKSIDDISEGTYIDGQGIRQDDIIEAKELFALFSKEESLDDESSVPVP